MTPESRSRSRKERAGCSCTQRHRSPSVYAIAFTSPLAFYPCILQI